MSSLIVDLVKKQGDVGETREEIREHLKESIKDSSDLRYVNELIDELCGEIYLIGLFEMSHGGDGVAQSEFCDWLDDYYRKSLSEELPPFPTLAPKAYKELTEAIPFSKRSTVEVDIRVGLWDEKGK